MATHTKRRPGAPRGLFAWEAAGLEWLREAEPHGGARIVTVHEWDDDHITEDALVSVPPTRQAAELFGRALAATHRFGAPCFGAAPDAWPPGVDGFIGDTPLPTGTHEHWGEFYASERVLPFARTAHDAGDLTTTEVAEVEHLCERLASGELDDGRPAARIHGDLWSGNVLWTAEGVVLIDPAAHGGHAETDLAMLALFGAPHLDVIRQAWAEAHEPADGWQQRVALHQVHPLLVHTVLFGRGYASQAMDAVRRYS